MTAQLKLKTAAGGSVTLVPTSTAADLTIVVPARAQPNSTAATLGDLIVDFNALLTKLRAAGVLA